MRVSSLHRRAIADIIAIFGDNLFACRDLSHDSCTLLALRRAGLLRVITGRGGIAYARVTGRGRLAARIVS